MSYNPDSEYIDLSQIVSAKFIKPDDTILLKSSKGQMITMDTKFGKGKNFIIIDSEPPKLLSMRCAEDLCEAVITAKLSFPINLTYLGNDSKGYETIHSFKLAKKTKQTKLDDKS